MSSRLFVQSRTASLRTQFLQNGRLLPTVMPRFIRTTSAAERWKEGPAPMGTGLPLNTKSGSLTLKQRMAVQLGKLLGYDRPASMAIRASRDLYATCAFAADDKAFYVHACGLPDNFHTWFAITNLHVWMLMVRLRIEKHGKHYSQEIVNRFFEDVEDRIRAHGVTHGSIVNSTVKDRIMAFRGGVLAYDEGMCKSDAVLAAALWRNVPSMSPLSKELAYMVRYTRQQLVALNRLPSEQLLQGRLKFMDPTAQLD